MFGYNPTEPSTNVIHIWATKYGKITVNYDGKALQISINHNNHAIPIAPSNIDGLPANINEIGHKELKAYFKNTYLIITPSEDNNYYLQIQPSMLGGGNTIDPENEKRKLWVNGIVPFEIDHVTYPVGENDRNTILQAVKEWNNSGTGFKLIPHTDETDYLIFGEAEGVCYSNVGRQGRAQYIRCDLDGSGFLEGRRFDKRSVKHEIGHTVGLYHEHQREDRKNFIKVVRGGRVADYKIGATLRFVSPGATGRQYLSRSL